MAAPRTLAVAVVHGVGRTESGFANPMISRLATRFDELTHGEGKLVCKPVYWSPVVQEGEDELWRRVHVDGALDFSRTRRFIMDFAADVVAYQPSDGERAVYAGIHARFAEALRGLALDAGGEAPLCVVAHSLGSVIASNYLYDLQAHFGRGRDVLPREVRDAMGRPPAPLERGETLTHFFTLGSPLALWSLRHQGVAGGKGFAAPVTVPAPQVAARAPQLAAPEAGTGWVNVYDTDDVLGYPLRGLNEAYHQAVRADLRVNAGGLITGATPLSHLAYWTDREVVDAIAVNLARTWSLLREVRVPVSEPVPPTSAERTPPSP